METITVDEVQCPYCAESIKAEAIKCRWCGEFLDEDLRLARLSEQERIGSYNFSPNVAAALSAIGPGFGQIYQGRIAVGFAYIAVIAALILFAAVINFIFGYVAIIIYVMNIVDAFNYRAVPIVPAEQ